MPYTPLTSEDTGPVGKSGEGASSALAQLIDQEQARSVPLIPDSEDPNGKT